MSTIAARIERLPLSRFHLMLLMIGGLGYLFDGLDSSSLAFILPMVKQSWGLSSSQVGLIASSTYIGYFFGAFLSGVLADILGRRFIMMTALAIYCVASFASAFMNDWPTFFACRILAGFGSGAEAVVIAPFLAEFIPQRYRGMFCGALVGFMSFGYFTSAILGYTVVSAFGEGWRYIAIITSLPVLMLLWWRRTLPESARWLESQGRLEEAEAVVAKIEAQFKARGIELPPVNLAQTLTPVQAGKSSATGNLKAIWSAPLTGTTALTWCMWFTVAFSYYSFFSWIPSLLVAQGHTVAKSFAYSIAIYGSQIPGYFSAAWLNEKIGRKRVVALYMTCGGLAAVSLAFSTSVPTIMAAGMCLSFFMNGAFAGVYAYTPELFPTSLRTTGVGTSSSFGRLGSVSAPILVGFVYPIAGFVGVFGMTTAVLALGALVVIVFGIETRNRSLEDISEQRNMENAANTSVGQNL